MFDEGQDANTRILQWLRDGDENGAVEMFTECSVDYVCIDVLFPVLGDGPEVDLCEARVRAPRRILELVEQGVPEGEAIEAAIRRCAEAESMHIRDIIWVPIRYPSPEPASDTEKSIVLARFDSRHVQEAWEKALQRKTTDLDGAITMSPTLLETVCKHILDARGVDYAEDVDLPKLYHLTAEQLKLAPGR